MGEKLTKEEVSEIVEEIKRGDSFANIARKHNAQYSSISKIAYRRGLKRTDIIAQIGDKPKRAPNKNKRRDGLTHINKGYPHDDGLHDCKPIFCDKKTMKKCMYGRTGTSLSCDYIGVEGKRRPCKPCACTKYRTRAQAEKWRKEKADATVWT